MREHLASRPWPVTHLLLVTMCLKKEFCYESVYNDPKRTINGYAGTN